MLRERMTTVPTLGKSGAATTARYSAEEKARAVRLCRERAAGKGSAQGVAVEVAGQLGYGSESVRRWWKQANIDDGQAPGRTSSDADRIAELEAENFELQRANDILGAAAAFFGAEIDRQHKK